jgi:uncharacterized membrane protein
METRRRSLAKALSWRVFATLITFGIAFAMTGELVFAASIGLADTTVKLVVYFAHERIWVRIPYGRIPPSDYQI